MLPEGERKLGSSLDPHRQIAPPVNWSDLPTELLDKIVNLMDTEIDLLRCRSVCRSWRSSAVCARRLTAAHQIIPIDGLDEWVSSATEFRIVERTISLVSSAPYIGGGWLVEVADMDQFPYSGKRLLHPLRSYKFRSLPENIPRELSMRRFRVKELHQLYSLRYFESFAQYERQGKAAMLFSDDSQFELLSVHRYSRLAKFDSRDRRWTMLERECQFQDVIGHKGRLLGLDCSGRLVIAGDRQPLTVAAVASPEFGGRRKCLVQSKDDELLLVDKYSRYDWSRSFRPRPFFRIHKLKEEEKSWLEVMTLGDSVLFLGNDSTFAISSADVHGLRNCIIFSDGRDQTIGLDDRISDECRNLYVFDMGSGDVTPLRDCPEHSKLFWPPPVWLSPPSLSYDDVSAVIRSD